MYKRILDIGNAGNNGLCSVGLPILVVVIEGILSGALIFGLLAIEIVYIVAKAFVMV
jgi:hypothetical protein